MYEALEVEQRAARGVEVEVDWAWRRRRTSQVMRSAMSTPTTETVAATAARSEWEGAPYVVIVVSEGAGPGGEATSGSVANDIIVWGKSHAPSKFA